MKVLLVANADWGLYNFRLPLARALRDQGMDVALVCPEGPYVPRLREAGFRVLVWRMRRRSVGPVSEAGAILHLARLYRLEAPHAVQHYTIKPIVYGSIAARLAGRPAVINTFTGVGFPFLDEGLSPRFRPFLAPLISRLLRGSRMHTVFHNPEDRDALVRQHIVSAGDTSVVLGSGVDTELFSPDTREREDGIPTVLMASRLLSDKGVVEYVEAARILRARGRQVRFLHAGGDDQGSRVAVPGETIEAWRREGVVEFLGHREDMPALLRQASVAVLPSYHEGLSRVLVEAAATGLPLVATRVGGCEAVVHEGENGYLVPPRDSQALAEGIDRLLGDADCRRRMGHASREIAEREFSVSRITQQYLDVYRRLGLLPGEAEAAEPGQKPPEPIPAHDHDKEENG